MSRLLFLPVLVTSMAICAVCSWFIWFDKPQARFSQEFNLGDNRILRVWSIRNERSLGDPCPLMIYYRIDQNRTELVPTTFIDLDDQGTYHFKALIAENGQLACVYDVKRGTEDCFMTILYDTQSGESWPRDRDNWSFYLEIKKKWRERFERVKREHPDYQIPHDLLK